MSGGGVGGEKAVKKTLLQKKLKKWKSVCCCSEFSDWVSELIGGDGGKIMNKVARDDGCKWKTLGDCGACLSWHHNLKFLLV
jgi:hypothetical protein